MLTKDKPSTIEKIRSFGPWVKWLVKKEYNEYKATNAYIEMLCPNPKVKTVDDTSIKKLEDLVRATIISEFGSRIEHSRGFNLLVNSVMYKLQKDALKEKQD